MFVVKQHLRISLNSWVSSYEWECETVEEHRVFQQLAGVVLVLSFGLSAAGPPQLPKRGSGEISEKHRGMRSRRVDRPVDLLRGKGLSLSVAETGAGRRRKETLN